MNKWLMAFRPKTLTAAVVPIVVATALVYALGHDVLWWVSASALLASLFIQIATNLFNDVIDFKKGADTEERIGPQRVTQSGVIEAKKVYLIAGFCLLMAFLLGVPLVVRGGLPIVCVGLISMFLAYSYTGGPWPLAYRGLGDIFVLLFFGLIAVAGVFYIHTLVLHPAVFIAGLQVGLLCTVLIAINNIRDVEQDKLVQKNTLPVRFGLGFARAEVLLLIVLSFACLLYWWFIGEHYAALMPLLFLPLALRLIRGLYQTPPSPLYNKFLAKSALLHLGFGMLLSLGLIIA